MKGHTGGAMVGLVAVALLAGCAHRQYTTEEMQPLGPVVSHFSQAVDAAAQDDPTGRLTGDQLRDAVKGRKEFQRLAPYRVLVMRQDRDTAVLVCTADGTRALFEDAGCTGKMERNRWQEAVPQPCQFTLDLAATCGSR